MAENTSGLGSALSGLVKTGFEALQSGLSEGLRNTTAKIFGRPPSEEVAARTTIAAGQSAPVSPATPTDSNAAVKTAAGIGAGTILLIIAGLWVLTSKRL